jgi:hypothetical protein
MAVDALQLKVRTLIFEGQGSVILQIFMKNNTENMRYTAKSPPGPAEPRRADQGTSDPLQV